MNQVDVTPADESQFSPLRIVPSYPDLPMESVYVRPAPRPPGVYLQQVGAGRVVYFPGDIDRTFWEVLNTDHGKLLRNAVEWATNEAPLVKVEGKGVLDVAVWEQQDSMTAPSRQSHQSHDAERARCARSFHITAQKISLQIPAGRRIKRVHLLTAARDVPYRSEGGTISLKCRRLRCMKWSQSIFRLSPLL